MNRRNLLKTAIGALVAVCGWKTAKAGPTIRFPRWFWGRIDSVGTSKIRGVQNERVDHMDRASANIAKPLCVERRTAGVRVDRADMGNRPSAFMHSGSDDSR